MYKQAGTAKILVNVTKLCSVYTGCWS